MSWPLEGVPARSARTDFHFRTCSLYRYQSGITCMLRLQSNVRRAPRRTLRARPTCEGLEPRLAPKAGNFLVSGDAPHILEYDLTGKLVKTISLPAADNIDINRDMTVDPDGNLQVYTKEFPSLLETLDAKTGQWSSHSF